MKNLLLALSIILLVSCTTTHNHYHKNDDNQYVRKEVIHHSYVDRGDHIVVLVKHKNKLNKHQRHRLRKWCNSHYKHHKKRVSCQFVLG